MVRLTALFLCCLSLFPQAPGSIETIAGTGSASFSGDGGRATLAALNVAVDVWADHAGNLFIADQFNHRIRKIAPDGTISTVAGTGTPGYSGDGGPATNAQINTPTGIRADKAGNLYIADVGNQRIRKVDASGMITTLAGNGNKGYGGDGGPASNASFYNPVRVAVDSLGNVLVADQSDHRIRRITPAGIITTFAGNGAGTPATGAFSGDGGPAISASLNNPTAVTVDSAGVVYIADQFNQRIRKVALDGTITTIAGNGNAGFSGDGGPAVAASLNYPGGITVDAAGNLYFNDDLNYRTRRIGANGTISTVAGSGVAGFSGDGGAATAASLDGNFGVTLDPQGNIYIADSMNNRVREVYAGPGLTPVISVAGVTNAASFASGSLVPGSIATVFGTNLTTSVGINLTSNLPLPTHFLDGSVMVNGSPAPIFAVDNVAGQQQINFQTPWELAPQSSATLQVEINGAASAVINVPVLSAQPGIFAYSASGNTFGAILHSNFQLADTGHPAAPGEIVLIYCTGLGAVSPAQQDGTPDVGSASTTVKPIVTIGGLTASVGFSGLAPTFVGLYQINATVPSSVGPGNEAVVITMGGIASKSVLLPVK